MQYLFTGVILSINKSIWTELLGTAPETRKSVINKKGFPLQTWRSLYFSAASVWAMMTLCVGTNYIYRWKTLTAVLIKVACCNCVRWDQHNELVQWERERQLALQSQHRSVGSKYCIRPLRWILAVFTLSVSDVGNCGFGGYPEATTEVGLFKGGLGVCVRQAFWAGWAEKTQFHIFYQFPRSTKLELFTIQLSPGWDRITLPVSLCHRLSLFFLPVSLSLFLFVFFLLIPAILSSFLFLFSFFLL